LAVVADEVVGGAGHGDAAFEQLHLELAERFGAAAILVRGQRADVYAARHSGLERPRDFLAIESEDQDVDAFARVLDRVANRCDAGVRLNDELHHGRAWLGAMTLSNSLASLSSAEPYADPAIDEPGRPDRRGVRLHEVHLI